MASTGERRPALDGLRGIAALVVVVHHTLLTAPFFASAYGSGADSWLLLSPLRLLWAGDVAVAVFFVLSGYVLARPFLAGRGGPWRAYYPKRLVRLYLPVMAAVALACAVVAAVPRSSSSGRSWWVDAQALVPTPLSALGDATLLRIDGLDNALWSLQYEVLFSLLLPVYVAAVVWLRRFPAAVAVGAVLAVSFAGLVTGLTTLLYLPAFALGALLADRESQLSGLVPPRHLVTLGVLGVVLSTPMTYPLQALGALCIVAVFVLSPRAADAISRPSTLWLGRVSYSLYLTHLPVVLLLASLLPMPGWWLLPVTVSVALAVAVVFHKAVEAPSQRLASRVASAWLLQGLNRRPVPPAEQLGGLDGCAVPPAQQGAAL